MFDPARVAHAEDQRHLAVLVLPLECPLRESFELGPSGITPCVGQKRSNRSETSSTVMS